MDIMSNNIDCFIILSTGSYTTLLRYYVYTTLAEFYMPDTMQDGQMITFKDFVGSLASSSIRVHATSGNTIDGSAYVDLNTEYIVKRFVYSSDLSDLMTL